MWKIGDGTQVNICSENWVPGRGPLIYSQDLFVKLNLSKVSMLINHDGHCWRRDLIELVFNPGTTTNILSIPLSMHGGCDVFHWPGTSDGQYTTKEGYSFLRKLLARDEASSSTMLTLAPKFWKKFWASRALPRCKETCWRALSGYLSLKERLFRCRVDVDPSCSFCAAELEEEDHLFLHCPAVKQVWFASQLAVRVDLFSSFIEFWLAAVELDDDDAVATIQSTIYALWEAQNSICFQQREFVVAGVLQRVRSSMEEAIVRDHDRGPMTALPARWKKPAPGTIKCNFDASFHDRGPSGLGMVARNSDGEVMVAACSLPITTLSPLLAEAMSMRWTMQLAINLGFRRIYLEMDHAIQEGRSYLSSIIHDCRLLLSAFDYVSVSIVRRTSNTVADFMARNAETYANLVWVEEVHVAAFHLVISDVMTQLPVRA
ncbi:uncharacterized protein LOC130719055 [Lotus japonicus]|uniref:uncharacterized protein LOC130719055 n=1 Tax=Lotus japonicus TaxID=34305 RepID=UPI00258C01EE|nr:uncharacterized protein LOC130719055 [Lotus japonicus]